LFVNTQKEGKGKRESRADEYEWKEREEEMMLLFIRKLISKWLMKKYIM